jgi:hypothetical protein
VKQYITRVLKAVACVLITFPLSYIVAAAILFDIPLNHCIGILLSPFYYIITFVAVFAGYGLWEMKRWAWYFFIISQVLVGYENAVFVLNYSASYHKILAYLISVVVQILVVYRVSKEVRVPYLFPRIRWWESNPRYRLSVSVNVLRKSGESLTGEILDISVAGCFIKLRPDLRLNESVTVQYRVFGYEMNCDGNVVWQAQSTVTHPKGIGVKFGLLQKSQKRALRHIRKRLKKISNFYRRSRYWMNQEEFDRQLEAIESNHRKAQLKSVRT